VSGTNIREIPPSVPVRKNDAPQSPAVTPASASTIAQADVIQAATSELLSQQMLEENKIRELAYLIWQAAGEPAGDGVQFWLEAQRQLAQTEN